MNDKEKFREHREIADIAWDLFCETGEIGFHNLYKRLSEDRERDARIDNTRNSTSEFGLSR